ncbi:SPOR domain-containing protein [Hydrogenophaga sp. R2]|uniref:SPOR domain-containing protein n=1 Tax=Hydrogenophaga sp. R2 TaxID=3132827 RepID=UPI003CF67B0D
MVNPRSGSAGSAPTPTIDAVRRRARHRLIGASVLVAVGVIGFPLLFDTQPRPIPVDIPIEIPARNTPSPAAKAPAAAPAPAAPAAAPAAASGGKLPMITEEADAPKAEAAKVEPPKAEAPRPDPVKAEAPRSEPAAPAPARPAPTDAARAEALLKGQADPKSASAAATASARLVVQVGAYAEDDRVRDVRQKLEKAGLKTYVHTATLPEGKRTRVRVGPFDNRAEAEKAAARIKALGLPAAVLTL